MGKLSPMKAKSLQDFCKLNRQNFDSGDFWILSNQYTIFVHEQKSGKPSKQNISIPKSRFDKLIKWYLREQKIK